MPDEKRVVRGRCLCGAISVSAEVAGRHVDACHCSMCRTWGGGPVLAVECSGPPQFDGEEHLAVYQSSEWAERGFCSRCGTHLFYRLREGGLISLLVGVLQQDAPDWQLQMEIFVDEKPSFYAFANDTEKLTGAEVFARFGASN